MSAIIKCVFALALVVLHRCLFGDLMPVDVYEHLAVPVVEEGTVFSWPKNYVGEVTVPDGIRHISGRAFSGCKNVTAVCLPDGIETIGNDAFANCESLIGINLPHSITNLGSGAFIGCRKLERIEIPPLLKCLPPSVFSGCARLRDIQIPESLTRLGHSAFSGCKALEHVVLPKNVTDIGDFAFCSCNGIKTFDLPDDLRHIGRSAFCDCKSLRRVSLPECLESIDDYAFAGCNRLEWVVFNGNAPKCKSAGTIFAGAPSGITILTHRNACGWREVLEKWPGRNVFIEERQSGERQTKGHIAFPAEILGLQTSVSGDTEGMVREEAYVPVKGDIFSHKIGLLKNETPRRIGGSVFVSVTRTCTEKTRKTVEIVADTEVMMESDEKAVMDLAKSIEDEIHGKLGLEHVGPFRLSVHQPSACGYVPLFTGGDGNYYARLEWHRMDSGKGFLRLLLRAVSKKAGTPYYEEAMAGKDAPTQDVDNSR